MRKTQPIKTIRELREKQEDLRLQLEKHEEELGQSWNYIQSNYKGMIWKEVNPFKGSKALNVALDLIQPGLLPVIAEVAKGSLKGNPLNLKVVGSSLKYAAASLGVRWLRKWLDKKEEGTENEANLSFDEDNAPTEK